MVHHHHGRPPRVWNLVRDPKPDEVGAPIDWSSWYLSWEDDVGQGPEQDQVVKVFSSVLQEHVTAKGWERLLVGRDAFFAWIPAEPNVRISPDVYLLDDPPPPPYPGMWETWRPGHRPPRFALEVVSEDWKKDYMEVPPKYAMLGAMELLLHDPEASRGEGGRKRLPLQLYRRQQDGVFERVYKGAGPVWLSTVEAWAVCRPAGGVGWLRLARDEEGRELLPTSAERARQEAERADAEKERADVERERANLEKERADAAALRAERLMARLRALGVDPAE